MQHSLNKIGEAKHLLRSAITSLRVKPQAVVDVVYPLPWAMQDLEPSEDLHGEDPLHRWLEFYIDALALKHEHPERVRLWPMDVFLKHHKQEGGADAGQLHKAVLINSLQAYTLEQQSPEAFELLESLEATAELNGRDPHLRQGHPPVAPALLESLLQLLPELMRPPQPPAPTQAPALSYPDLSGKVADLEKALAAEKAKPVPAPAYPDVRGKVAELEKALADEKAKPVPTAPPAPAVAYPNLSGKVKELEELLKDSQEEAELLLLQLHQVQEELERYYLEAKALKDESEASINALNEARELLNKAREGARA
jgi:hypothetical protein